MPLLTDTSHLGAACLRLKWTRERVPRESLAILHELESLMSMQGSFHVYREFLAKVSPPCVPYIGVCLSDLTFAEDGNPDRMCVDSASKRPPPLPYVFFVPSDGLLSWSKISLIYRIIFDATRFQATPYDFAPNAEMQSFIAGMPTMTEEEQYKHSLMHEPRNALKEEIK